MYDALHCFLFKISLKGPRENVCFREWHSLLKSLKGSGLHALAAAGVAAALKRVIEWLKVAEVRQWPPAGIYFEKYGYSNAGGDGVSWQVGAVSHLECFGGNLR